MCALQHSQLSGEYPPLEHFALLTESQKMFMCEMFAFILVASNLMIEKFMIVKGALILIFCLVVWLLQFSLCALIVSQIFSAATVKVMACEQEAGVVPTQLYSDSNLAEIEKPRDEEEESPEDVEPLAKKLKVDDVDVVETVQIPAPKTPPLALQRLRRQTLDPESPWAQQKVAMPVSGDRKGTFMKSKAKRGGITSSGGEWKEIKGVEKIWTCMMVAQSTCILVLGWQDEPTNSGYNGSLCFNAWGLSEKNQWVRIACWGTAATAFHQHLKTLSGQSRSSFAYISFSKVRHNRDGKVMENCIGIKVDPECQFKNEPEFVGAEGPMLFQPKPVLSSNMQMCERATEQSRYFLKVKIHQVYGIESYPNSSDRLTVLLVDMGGNALRAVVWPPYAHHNIWNDGECVLILGAKVNKQYNQVIVNSDAVVLEDEAANESDYPQEVAPLQLSSMQAHLPAAEFGA